MNQKGGVGKTTCTANLGAGLALRGKRVLLVDMDPQANLSLHWNVNIHELEHSVYTVLTGQSSARAAILFELRPGVSLLPANIDLSGAEIELVNSVGRETLLRTSLARLFEEETFDYVLLDCPPSLGLLSLNALTCAHEVFIPLQTEFFALQGMTRLLEVVELIKGRLGHDLEITGIIPTLYDVRTNLSREVDTEIREFFGERVFKTIVHQNVRLAEAPSHGKTIFEYAADSVGARDFEALTDEVLRREAAEPAP
jgi:chromosome partitioning protein